MKDIIVFFNPFTRDLILYIKGVLQENRVIEMDSWEYFDYNDNDAIALHLETDETTRLSLHLQDNEDSQIYTVAIWTSDGVNNFQDASEVGIIVPCNSVLDMNTKVSQYNTYKNHILFELQQVSKVVFRKEPLRSEVAYEHEIAYLTALLVNKLGIKPSDFTENRLDKLNSISYDVIEEVKKYTENGFDYIREAISTAKVNELLNKY